jgi:A/G-specific adenine glycosylase
VHERFKPFFVFIFHADAKIPKLWYTAPMKKTDLFSPTKAQQKRGREAAAALLSWYKKNARSLVFRGTKDPYRIWLSEIMLQQTRTETVEGYYTRFLERFPNAHALAAATQEEVLKLWEGLGYYSRARNLHKCAKIISEQGFPSTVEELQKLPGIGPYTAAAIASIAFDVPVPAIDGNLKRVIARLFYIEENINAPSVQRKVTAFGQALMPTENGGTLKPSDSGHINQALMDLGATLCTPGTPDCAACPIQKHCLALKEGDPASLPLMDRKNPPKEIDLGVMVVVSQEGVLIHQREERLLKGMHVFVLAEDITDTKGMKKALANMGLGIISHGQVVKAKHIFTHRVWNMRIVPFICQSTEAPKKYFWAKDLDVLAFPTAMKKAKEIAKEAMERFLF